MSNDDPTKKTPDEFAEQLWELTSPLYAMQKQVNELLSLVGQININVESITTRVEGIESHLGNVQQGIIDLNIRVESVEDKLKGMESKQNNIEQGIINLGARVEKLESGISHVEQGVINLGTRLEVVESKAETIETAVKTDLQKQIAELEKVSFGSTITIRDSINSLGRKIDVMNKELLTIKAEHDEIFSRVDDLEKKPV